MAGVFAFSETVTMNASEISRDIMTLIVLGSIVSASVSVYRFGIKNDYYIEARTSCEPSVQSCYQEIDESGVTAYYATVYKKAYLIPVCDGWVDECPELKCDREQQVECQISFCDSSSGENCSESSTN